MLGQHRRQWCNIQSTERQVNVFTGPSKFASILQTDLYTYIKVQNLSEAFWLMEFEVRILKSKILIQNA